MKETVRDEKRERNLQYLRDYYQDHREKALAYQKNWALQHPEERKATAERFKLNHPTWSRDYERNHRDERNARRRERRAADPEIFNKRQRVRCRAHPHRVREYHLKRNGCGEVPQGALDLLFWDNLYQHHGLLKCAYCRYEIQRTYHVDHILAVDNGGTNSIDNLCITCPSCNESKGKKDVDVWLWEKASKEWLIAI